MKTQNCGWLGVVLGTVLVAVAGGAEPAALTKEMRARLERDGFCISGETAPGMAGPYLDAPEVPLFITSDSLLAYFHGMLRETVTHRDAALAKALAAGLADGWGNLEKLPAEEPGADPLVCKAAMTRAKIVCGTARRMLDPAWHAADPAIEREIAAEAARVEAAEEKSKPGWLGEPEPCFMAIDYSSCKPVGLQAENPDEARYFRAVRFLQMIPFRLSRQEELFSACYILRAFAEGTKRPALRVMNNANELIGEAAIAFSGSMIYPMESSAPPLRSMLGEGLTFRIPAVAPPYLINNLVANRNMPVTEYDTRMIAPLAPPDSLVFQRVMDKFMRGDPPDPLLAAAWFGDKQAKAQMILLYPGCDELLITRNSRRFDHGIDWERRTVPLFESYYAALRTLMSGPDDGAPRFMRKDAWHLKTRQTVLASWARMRNCFALEAPDSSGLLGGPKGTPGFVEPVPEFYQKLGSVAGLLAAISQQTTELDAAIKDPNAIATEAVRWLDFELLCSRLEAMAHKQLRGIEWNDADRMLIGAYGLRLLNNCDDPPRAVAVARSGVSGTTRIAAAGAHRVIWVNYPWKGKTVLCRGAVMTFYSLTAPAPLTDTEWQARLKARPAPQPPAWLLGICF